MRVLRAINWARLFKIGWVPFCLVLAACHLDMYSQPKVKPYAASSFFSDGAGARPLQPGTVARGQAHTDEVYYTGLSDGQPITEFPPQVKITQDLLNRGQDRFGIFCTPCHGALGAGNGTITSLLNPHPPSFYLQRLRDAPVGHYFDVITHGKGAMYSYASRVNPDDRWAIIAYIRDLQAHPRPGLTPAQLNPTEAPTAQSTAEPASGTATSEAATAAAAPATVTAEPATAAAAPSTATP